MRTSSIYLTLPALAAALAVGAGCSRHDEAVRDSAAGDVTVTPYDSTTAPAAATPRANDEGNSDAEHTAAVDARFGPAQSTDHEFLRMMADHHEGLVAMTVPVLDQAVNETTRADARRLHDEQQRELRTMLSTIESKYGESYEPSVLPSNRVMLDSLSRSTGAAFDTLFYRQLIAHHQQGVQMIEQHLPDLQDANVKAMAEKMRAQQVRETAEFERKM